MSRPLLRRTLISGLGVAAAGMGATALAGSAAAAPTRGKGQALIGRARRGRLHVMSFNIRMENTANTQPGDADHWPEREGILVDLLEREQPTVLGVQEAKFGQLPAIEQALPDHRMLGYGRKGGSADEYSAIFYDPSRLEVLGWDQFWLSDTPEVIGSATWGNRVTRIVVHARMRELATGTEFVMVNTHLDHESEEARVKSAQAIVDLIGDEDPAGLPILVTGDFNSPAPDGGAYRTLVTDGPQLDAWDTAAEQLTPAWGTFGGYEQPVEGGDRIDVVLVSEGVTVHEAGINAFTGVDGRFPSDHLPMQALLSLS